MHPVIYPASAPVPHRAFVARALPILQTDPRIVGVAAAGSWADDRMDDQSDLDLVLGVAPAAFADVLADRDRLAASLGTLLAAFTGEHVGEPRVLICLYDAPLLHVDLKFVAIDEIGATVDRPAVLWQRDRRFEDALANSFTGYPRPDPAWIEARFWTWIHYGAAKVARGELYEALDHLGYLRARVLGPLVLARLGKEPAGVRRFEQITPDWAARLRDTVATLDPLACLGALASCVAHYRDLRPSTAPTISAAEAAATAYLEAVARRLRSVPDRV